MVAIIWSPSRSMRRTRAPSIARPCWSRTHPSTTTAGWRMMSPSSVVLPSPKMCLTGGVQEPARISLDPDRQPERLRVVRHKATVLAGGRLDADLALCPEGPNGDGVGLLPWHELDRHAREGPPRTVEDAPAVGGRRRQPSQVCAALDSGPSAPGSRSGPRWLLGIRRRDAPPGRAARRRPWAHRRGRSRGRSSPRCWSARCAPFRRGGRHREPPPRWLRRRGGGRVFDEAWAWRGTWLRHMRRGRSNRRTSTRIWCLEFQTTVQRARRWPCGLRPREP